MIGAGFGHNIHHAPAVVAVLGVKVVGQNPELGDGIEVGNHQSAAVHEFLHIAPVDHEAVGVFPLAPDGLIAGVQHAGGGNRDGDASHDDRIGLLRRGRNDPRLQG